MRRRELLGGLARGIAGLWLGRILPAKAEAPTARRERELQVEGLEELFEGYDEAQWRAVAVAAQDTAQAMREMCAVLTIPWHIASDTEKTFLPEVRSA